MYPYASLFYFWANDSVGSLLRREAMDEKLAPNDVQIVLEANAGSNDPDIARYQERLQAGEFRQRRGRPSMPVWKYVYAHALYGHYHQEEVERRKKCGHKRMRGDIEVCHVAMERVAREMRSGDGRASHNRFYLKRKAARKSAALYRAFLMKYNIAV